LNYIHTQIKVNTFITPEYKRLFLRRVRLRTDALLAPAYRGKHAAPVACR